MSRTAWAKLLALLRPLKGWQAVPAAFLAIYLLVGLLGPPTSSGMSVSKEYVPSLGAFDGRVLLLDSDSRDKDVFQYTLELASLIGRNVLPAVALGVAVGWGLAWGVGKLPRGMRIVAYVVLALALMPAAALQFNLVDDHYGFLVRIVGFDDISLPYLNFIGAFFQRQDFLQAYSFYFFGSASGRIEYLSWYFQLALAATMCTFLLATLLCRRRHHVEARKSATRKHVDCTDANRAHHAVACLALSALASLALATLLMTTWLWDLMPYEMCIYTHLSFYYPESPWPINPCGWGSLPWYNWAPVASLLVVLACIGLLVMRLFNFVRPRSFPRQPPESPEANTRSLWLIISATLAAVFLMAAVSGLIAQLALAGAVCGGAFAALREYGSRNTRNGQFILVSLAIAMSMVLTVLVLGLWFSDRYLPIEHYPLPFILIVLFILWWWRGSESGWYRLALNAVGACVILAAVGMAAMTFVTYEDHLLINQSLQSDAHTFYVAAFIGIGAGLAVLLSVRSKMQSAFDSIAWAAIAAFTLIFMRIGEVISPHYYFSDFDLFPRGLGGESVFDFWGIEDWDLIFSYWSQFFSEWPLFFFGAFVVAYAWRVAIGSRMAPRPVQDQKSGWDWSSFLSSMGTAVGVVAASFAVVYGAAAILLSETNFYQSAAYLQNGLLAKLGYESVGGRLATGEWVYWINLYAFCLELIVIMGAGVFAYSRLTRGATHHVFSRGNASIGCVERMGGV